MFFIIVHSVYGQKLLKGPYIQDVRENRATVCWVTQESLVKFGINPNNLTNQVSNFKVHETLFEQLKPNTIYYYDIGFGEAGKGHFKTAPNFATPFRFVIVGDTRFADKPSDIQKKLIAAIENQKPAFVINTGDLVTSGDNPVHWDTFFKLNHNLLKSVPYYVSLGNHEKNSHYFYDYFSFPGKENYFSFNWSNCHFIILDSSGPYENPVHPLDYEQWNRADDEIEKFWNDQLSWLCGDLKNHRQYDFTFIIMHQPLFSLKESRREEQKDFQKRFARIFDDFEIDVVFSGHDHTYQRHYVNPVHYVVTAGGGASLYKTGKPFAKYTRKVLLKYHYVLVEIDGKQFKSTALTENGEIIDNFSIPFDARKDKKRAEKELRLKEIGTYDTYF